MNVDFAALRLFEHAFLSVVDGSAEDDGFNQLVLGAGLAWREVALLRAYCKYLRQTGTLFSQRYIEMTLAAHCHLAVRRLVELFVARLDPWTESTSGGDDPEHLTEMINEELDAVTSLDEDRILRALLDAFKRRAHLGRVVLRGDVFSNDRQDVE